MLESYIHISIKQQLLILYSGEQEVFKATVSTAKNGAGEILGSECTPRGWHYIRAKIGAGCIVNTVFVGRRPTGEIYESAMSRQFPERDWILTRILWLCGREPGYNRLGNVDTMRRYIYIHGCPDEDSLGVPGSHGCIKMKNEQIVQLFDLVETGTQVHIVEE